MEPIGNILKNIDAKVAGVGTGKAAPTTKHAIEVHGLKLYPMAELMSMDFPDPVWIVDSLIPEGITVLSAVPASYKTWLLLSIAMHVASGDMLFNHFVTDQTGLLLVDEENSMRLLQQRLKLMGASDDLPIYFLAEQGFQLEDKLISDVIRFCVHENIGLITIDSLVRIHRGNENDATQMADVFAKIRRFTKAGISVLITHHHRKGKSDNPAQDMRGSSDILAAVDCHLTIKRESRNILLTQTKVRFSEERPAIELEVNSTEDMVSFRYLGDLKPQESKKAKVILAITQFLTDYGLTNQKDLGLALEELGLKTNAKTLRVILNEMVAKEHLNKSSGRGNELLYSIKN